MVQVTAAAAAADAVAAAAVAAVAAAADDEDHCLSSPTLHRITNCIYRVAQLK